jgi:signal transduction histidine kinase
LPDQNEVFINFSVVPPLSVAESMMGQAETPNGEPSTLRFLKALLSFIVLSTSSAICLADVIPKDTEGWDYKTGFAPTGPDSSSFEASSTAIVDACKQNPNSYINFPFAMQLSQKIFLDGRLINTTGIINPHAVSTVLSQPVLSCEQVIGGKTLLWRAEALANMFARISRFPYVSAKPDLVGFMTTMLAAVAAGGAIAFALVLATLFRGNIRRDILFALVAACFGIALNEFGQISSIFGIYPELLSLHKVLLLGDWTAITGVFYAYCVEGFLPKWLFRVYLANLAVAGYFMFLGSNGTVIQTGSTYIFPVSFLMLCFLTYRTIFFRSTERSAWNRIVTALSPLSIIFSSVIEILNLLNVTHLPYFLGTGYVLGIMAFAVHVNVDIEKAYSERDFLRENLAVEVKNKTSELSVALSTLKKTQAELIQSAKLASLGTLSAGLAHEINNSLNYMQGSINGIARIVKESVPIERQVDANNLLQIMRRGLEVTLNIVKSLKSHTSFSQDRLSLVVIADAVKTSLTLLTGRCENASVQVEVDPNIIAFSNLTSLGQIFTNLVSNSLDAIPKDRLGTILISARVVSQNREWVEIVVKDNGEGISTVVQTQIFDPFFTTKDIGFGSGLGLHIVRSEVLRNRGTVACESAVGDGTTFTIRLPATEKAFKLSEANDT